MNGKYICMVVVLLAAACFQVYSQDPEPVVPASVYYDFLFNDYMELESVILEKYGTGTLGVQDFGVIDDLRRTAEQYKRKDIISRLDMLAFIVRTSVEQAQEEQEPDDALAAVVQADKVFRRTEAASKNFAIGAGIAIGTAVVTGSIFTAAALLSESFYNKYIEAEIAEQAGFYLFWWQTMDRIALAGAISAIVSGTAAGVFAALY